jgi:hypothetical protein
VFEVMVVVGLVETAIGGGGGGGGSGGGESLILTIELVRVIGVP